MPGKTSCCWFSSTLPRKNQPQLPKKNGTFLCFPDVNNGLVCLRWKKGGWSLRSCTQKSGTVNLQFLRQLRRSTGCGWLLNYQLDNIPWAPKVTFHVFVVISIHIWLVVEVSTPSEQYAQVKLGSSSPNRGENKRYLSCHHLDLVGLLLTLSIFPLVPKGSSNGMPSEIFWGGYFEKFFQVGVALRLATSWAPSRSL